jgi:hypothetical protein
LVTLAAAPFVERPAAALEDLGVAVGLGQELVGKRVLRSDVADKALQPADERVPWCRVAQVIGRAAERLDLRAACKAEDDSV